MSATPYLLQGAVSLFIHTPPSPSSLSLISSVKKLPSPSSFPLPFLTIPIPLRTLIYILRLTLAFIFSNFQLHHRPFWTSHCLIAPVAASTRSSTHSPASIARRTTYTDCCTKYTGPTIQIFPRKATSFPQPTFLKTPTCLRPARLVIVSPVLEQKTPSIVSNAPVPTSSRLKSHLQRLTACSKAQQPRNDYWKRSYTGRHSAVSLASSPSRPLEHSRRCSCPFH